MADKSEQRVRALGLQAIDRPEYALHLLDVRPEKSSKMKVLGGVSAPVAGDTTVQVAVQRIGLDPKVTSGRWWLAEPKD